MDLQTTIVSLLAVAVAVAAAGLAGCPSTDDDDMDDDDIAADDDHADSPDWDGDGYTQDGGDCNDGDPDIHPDAAEECNFLDDDCDGEVDEDLPTIYSFRDGDGDGYGDVGEGRVGCDIPDGFVTDSTDCDDTDATIHPGATEVLCDGVDNDCDGNGGEAAAAEHGGVEFGSIQDAVDGAADGDTVHICPGTHTETLFIGVDRVLTLTSWSGSAADTVLDGENVRTPLLVATNTEVLLADLSFINGFAYWDGGAIASEGASLTVQRCVFEGNFATVNGGAISVLPIWDDFEVVIEACSFVENWAGWSYGAIGLNGHGSSTLTVRDTTFERNTAMNGDGGAIGSGSWDPIVWTISDTTFTENAAERGAGTVSLNGDDGADLQITNSAFHGNTAHSGAAIDLGQGLNRMTVTEVWFEGNQADDGGAIDIGGRDGAEVEFASCTFSGNIASEAGSVFWIHGQVPSHRIVLSGTTLDSNTAGHCGAICCDGDGIDLTLTAGAVTGNSGGGVLLEDDTVLTSDLVDWGTGATNNDPYDVNTGAQTYDFGAGASFVCHGNGECG